MPTTVASEFMNSFKKFLKGNQEILNAISIAINLNATTMAAQQNNPYGL